MTSSRKTISTKAAYTGKVINISLKKAISEWGCIYLSASAETIAKGMEHRVIFAQPSQRNVRMGTSNVLDMYLGQKSEQTRAFEIDVPQATP